MSSILNKILKVSLCVVLCVAMCLCMTACTKKTRDIKDVNQIAVTGTSKAGSFMNTFADEDFVKEMVQIYNDLECEKTDTPVNMTAKLDTYSLTYYNGSESEATFVIDSENICSFAVGGQSYTVTSESVYDEIDALIQDASKKVAEDFEKAKEKEELMKSDTE